MATTLVQQKPVHNLAIHKHAHLANMVQLTQVHCLSVLSVAVVVLEREIYLLPIKTETIHVQIKQGTNRAMNKVVRWFITRLHPNMMNIGICTCPNSTNRPNILQYLTNHLALKIRVLKIIFTRLLVEIVNNIETKWLSVLSQFLSICKALNYPTSHIFILITPMQVLQK